MYGFRLLVAATAMVGLACGSSTASDPPIQPLTAAGADPAEETVVLDLRSDCEVAGQVGGADPIAALTLSVELLEGVGTEAGARSDGCAIAGSPLCAGLFLIGATDPLSWYGFTATSEIERVTVLHERALLGSATIAGSSGDRELEVALIELARLDPAAAFALGDSALTELAMARVESRILDPIVAAEAAC